MPLPPPASFRAAQSLLSTAALLLVLTACGGEGGDAKPPRDGAKKARPPHLVELATPQAGQLEFAADRPGSLRALHEVKIVNQEDGQLTELRVREGDRVTAGQVLARYDDRLLRATLDKAEAALAQAEADHERARRLVEQGFLSAEAMSRSATALQLARADSHLARTRLQRMTLTAPMAGVVAQRLVEPGDATRQHSHLLTLIDPSRLVTEVAVSELLLPKLRVGGAARVRIDALGAEAHPGRILRIHPTLDPASRSGRVEVLLEPLPAGARPGQFCRVTFGTAGAAQLILPLAAIQRDGGGEYVFVHADDSTVRRQPVTTGQRLADRVEIVDGLSGTERVVVKGFLELTAGRKVKPVTRPPASPARGD